MLKNRIVKKQKIYLFPYIFDFHLGAFFDKADSMGYSLSDYMSFGSVTATCLVIIVNAQVCFKLLNMEKKLLVKILNFGITIDKYFH